jgi:FeS assembly SUF system protein
MTDLDDRTIAVPAVPIAQAPLARDANGLIEAVIAALRTVHDPEIPVNIYDLGLIYRIAPDHQGAVEIDMTLTAPGCPVAGEMMNWVRTAVSDVDGIESVKVNLVFDPPWDKSKMSEDVQLELGLL